MDIVDNDIKEMLYNIIETYELDDEITDNIIELEKSIVEMICNNMNSLYDDFEKMYVENVKKIVKEELGKKNIIEEDVNKIDTISISDASEITFLLFGLLVLNSIANLGNVKEVLEFF